MPIFLCHTAKKNIGYEPHITIINIFDLNYNYIETEDIEIHLLLRLAKSSKEIFENKNFVFRIKKDIIGKLFNEIYSYES